jgi:DUF218 domain
MTHTISRENYIDLLDRDRIIPKIIENTEEYEQFLAVAEKLISKKQTRTIEETVLFRLLVKLIKDYEEETYSIKEYRQGLFKNVIVSGGVGKEGFDEAVVMKQYLITNTLPPEQIYVDSQGNNTYLTAQHTAQLMTQYRWQSAIAINLRSRSKYRTQYHYVEPRFCHL